MTRHEVTTIDELQNLVRTLPQVAVRGGGSKTALTRQESDVTWLDMRPLSGILEYEPGEFTFTALAGTPIATVEAALAEHGQYLPFGPPFAQRGATLGGTVAAGLSGSERYRYGGVRDFLIGLRFVDGQGNLVRGGGKVVKNAAGFDFPKLMVGSLGRLGVLAEVSFKVFPRPSHYATLRAPFPHLAAALQAQQQVADARFDLEAFDIVVHQIADQPLNFELLARLGGAPNVLMQRLNQVRATIGVGELIDNGSDETNLWQNAREFTWAPPDFALVKVPTTPSRLPALEAALAAAKAQRRYAVGGNLTWIAWPGGVDELHALLTRLNLGGLFVLGGAILRDIAEPRIGLQTGHVLAQRIQQALDPEGRFRRL